MNEWVISFLQFILTRHLEFNFLKKKNKHLFNKKVSYIFAIHTHRSK